MPGRIRRKRWPQVVVSAFVTALLVVGWWLEGRYLRPSGWQRPQGQLQSGEYDVRRVVDGDTIVLAHNDLRVRLQGIDTPETVRENTAVEPWGYEAGAYTRQFVRDSDFRVRVEIDGEPVDRYGRHLAFIWHEGRLLNEELVDLGLARAKTDFDFSQAMKQRLLKAQLEAQAAERGIWGGTLPP